MATTTSTCILVSSEIPEWLQEFREHLVDESIPERQGARVLVLSDSQASSFHETSLEPMKRVVSGNHSIYTHFLKDRKCEICQETTITRVPCRRRISGVVLRAENVGDLITADHQIHSDGCESRNNHRYAVVVQDSATPWIQSYPWETKTSQEIEWSLQTFLEATGKPKVIYTDNSLEFGNACEDLSGNHCTTTPQRSETNGNAERAVRKIKEGTSAILLQSGMAQVGGRIPWNYTAICEVLRTSCLMGRHHTKGVSVNNLIGLIVPFGS